MAKRDTSLNVDVNGDVTGIEAALRKGGRDLKQYERSVNSAKRALDELERESLKASVMVSKAERDLAKAADEHAAAQQRAWKQTQQSGSAMGSLVATAALLGPAVATAGTAVVAFGALAAPSIYKVVAAQSDMAGQWDTLDGRQKVAAVGTQRLVDEYKRLAKSYEPEALAAYNNALSVTRQILPELAPLAKQGGIAFGNLTSQIGDMLTGSAWQGLFSTVEQHAVPDMQLLGTVVTNTGDTFASLVTDLLPLGETLLEGAGGVTKLLAEFAQVSPTAVQLGVSMWALHKPAAALVGTAGSIATKFKGASKVMGLFGGETKGASIASGLLKDSAAGLPGIITGAVVVAGALALKLGSMKSASELAAASLIAQNNAVGNNVAGYERTIPILKNLVATQTRTVTSYNNFGRAVSRTTIGQTGYVEALKQQQTAFHNVTSASGQLAAKFGGTADQARQLADAAGIDLSQAIDKSGHVTTKAINAFAQYRAAVQLANNPVKAITLDLDAMANATLKPEDRIKAMTDAMNRSFVPSIAYFQDTTNLRNAQSQLAAALKKSHGQIGLETQKQRDARGAFANYITQTEKAATDQYQLAVMSGHGKQATRDFRKSIIDALPKLYAYAGNNKEARSQVNQLATAAGLSPRQIAKLNRAAKNAGKEAKTAAARIKAMRWEMEKIPRDTSADINVNAHGNFIFQHPGQNTLHNPWSNKPYPRNAGGGLIRGAGGARSDKAGLYALSNDEFVVNAPATRKYLPQLVAMNDEGNRGTQYRTSGLAGGGLAGGGRPNVKLAYADDNVRRGWNWEKTQAVKATAQETAAYMKKLMSAPGGSGSKRWAPLILQVLSMLGMSPSLLGGVETLITRESGGNPNAINLTDSNAAAGHPSQGLMQTIPGTFNAYAGPYRGLGITNPLANIYAGLNYIRHRYPSLAPLRPGWVGGYDSGGRWPSGTLGINTTGEDERVLTPRQNRAFEQLVARLPVKRLDVPATAAAGGGDRPYIGSMTVQTTERASADQIIDSAIYKVRVAARGGAHQR